MFRGTEWKIGYLDIMRRELQALRASNWLKRGGPVDKKFGEIQTIFSKYDEISGFISNCNNYSPRQTQLTESFPIPHVQEQILRAATYLRDGLENEYVNHCARLHDGLEKVPKAFFNAHVKYLDHKIDFWSGKYRNREYNSGTYGDRVFAPLKKEIKAFDNDIYQDNDFNRESTRLSVRWDQEGTQAFKYFSN